eukprot:CAMPEP_0115503782 /NCGR_PEP_ID=MMETSP0271-20121206/69663_1 /TAXON_ID=71861 /ORGANISM="Scrippsiella trochoidea, Strain CCMP3099" /LENGTH=112 /DNA_ID=CAMNT_0002932903 /DNA_START=222 /DNA_END=557 /DNA_ORIENTATION=-
MADLVSQNSSPVAEDTDPQFSPGSAERAAAEEDSIAVGLGVGGSPDKAAATPVKRKLRWGDLYDEELSDLPEDCDVDKLQEWCLYPAMHTEQPQAQRKEQEQQQQQQQQQQR